MQILDHNRPRKMVFYGRVSTEQEEQLSALQNQMQWYDDQFQGEWNGPDLGGIQLAVGQHRSHHLSDSFYRW